MCGICGIVRRDGAGIETDVLENMALTMRHRGPDDQGVWRSRDGRAGLGHRRLSIIDLSPAGHQPMADASGNAWISFNGEIYNYLELKAELEAAGHHFNTATDNEVILAAYERWDVECVKKLNGMFAFAIYDEQRQRLFLARDRAGEKPLYFRHHRGSFAFASEIKALMRDPSFERRIDIDAFSEFLTFGYVSGASSMLKGVRKLPQGCAMTYDVRSDAVTIWPYWTLPQPVNGARLPEEALLDRFEALLLDSVRMRLIADVPVGIMLSGGLDSSLVTAMASRVSSKPVRTFTITFPGHGAFDESQYARIVASHFGTDHIELAAEAATVDLLPELARQYDEPMADSSMVPTYLVSRLIRRDATVALGGDGGDELFGGYLHYRWVQRQDFVRRFVPGPVRAVSSAIAGSLPVGLRGRNYLVGMAGDIDRSIAHANLFFDVKTRRKLLAPLGLSIDDGPERKKAGLAIGRTASQRAMAVDFRSYLVDDILVKVDRASMLASLEVRAPLLDPRIIEFAYGSVPDPLRTFGGRRKILLRKLAGRVLPSELDVTRKQGFGIPLAKWFKGDWGKYMREVLSQADPAVFDPSVVASVIAGQQKGLANTQRIFALTMFELWRREYGASF